MDANRTTVDRLTDCADTASRMSIAPENEDAYGKGACDS